MQILQKERNIKIYNAYQQKDRNKKSIRAIAGQFGISHVRVLQIVRETEARGLVKEAKVR